ncbi:MAG: peptidoglycan DD-metalloendopeptidase family protein [bacterium]|nr:peptidoglycan DD-metalloendopeptidase family protein [bacterium]
MGSPKKTNDKSSIDIPGKFPLWKRLGFPLAGLAIIVIAVLGVFGAAKAGWLFKDEEAPKVTITTPQEGAKYEGEITVVAEVADNERLGEVTVTLDDADYTPDFDLKANKRKKLTYKLKLNTALFADGKHKLTFAAEDESGNTSEETASFYTDNTPTIVELSFDSERVEQGRILQVTLNSNEKLYNLEGSVWEQEFPFFDTEDGYKSVMAIRASCPTGDYPIKVTGFDANDEKIVFEGTVKVADGGYIEEHIVISSPKTKGLFDPALEERKQRDYARVQAKITKWNPEQYWAGKFIVPVEGRLTSPFGTYRTFSTGGSERHLGTDYAAKEGTPIRAANRGKVVLAEKAIIRGNYVCIDHGKGVFTLYNHMSAHAVREGDMVEKGQVIGFIGATGVSTGPHVHWEMRVFKWVTDALQWTREEFTYREPDEERVALAEIEAAYEEILAAPIPEPLTDDEEADDVEEDTVDSESDATYEMDDGELVPIGEE